MYRYEFDDDEPERISQEVVSVVSAVDDTDPLDLPPLAETVDPDALDALFDHENDADRRLTFYYYSYRITVTADGIRIQESPNE
jgi:hypothetical protein